MDGMVVMHQTASDEVEIYSSLFYRGEWFRHLLYLLFPFYFESFVCCDRTWVEDGHRLDLHPAKCLDEVVLYIIWDRRRESLWAFGRLWLPGHPVLDQSEPTL
jgi:hypothetical protein